MTVPALILFSLLALVALPVVSQISGSAPTRSSGIHGSKDSGPRSTNADDSAGDRRS
jgi:hypothetical protein